MVAIILIVIIVIVSCFRFSFFVVVGRRLARLKVVGRRFRAKGFLVLISTCSYVLVLEGGAPSSSHLPAANNAVAIITASLHYHCHPLSSLEG